MPGSGLAGLKVLDLTHYIAGPYCTRLMAGWGAEVIKVENPIGGDGARRLGPFPGDEPHPEQSGLFLWLNANKKGITLNLRSATGVGLFKELVRQVDLVVENFAPRVMPALGLSYEELAEANPRLVMTSISNFGQSGPYRDYKATEMVLYALSGLMFITGEPGREPLKVGIAQTQLMAGQYAFVASLGAAWHASKTGQGQRVDVAIAECAAGGLTNAHLQWYSYGGGSPKRIGNGSEKGHPHGILPCRDGYFALSAAPRRWRAFAEVTGCSELLEPRFASASGRLEHREEFDQYVLPWLAARGKVEAFHRCQEAGLVAGWVRNAQEIRECPHLNAREFFLEVEHPAAGRVTVPAAPVRLTKTPWGRAPAPLLGQHNAEVYGERLGYSREELVRLRQGDVI